MPLSHVLQDYWSYLEDKEDSDHITTQPYTSLCLIMSDSKEVTAKLRYPCSNLGQAHNN